MAVVSWSVGLTIPVQKQTNKQTKKTPQLYILIWCLSLKKPNLEFAGRDFENVIPGFQLLY